MSFGMSDDRISIWHHVTIKHKCRLRGVGRWMDTSDQKMKQKSSNRLLFSGDGRMEWECINILPFLNMEQLLQERSADAGADGERGEERMRGKEETTRVRMVDGDSDAGYHEDWLKRNKNSAAGHEEMMYQEGESSEDPMHAHSTTASDSSHTCIPQPHPQRFILLLFLNWFFVRLVRPKHLKKWLGLWRRHPDWRREREWWLGEKKRGREEMGCKEKKYYPQSAWKLQLSNWSRFEGNHDE